MKQEEKDYNENQLGMALFLYNFSETLDKQREMGGEAFIAKKSKEASLMRNYIQHVKEKLLESIQSLASQKRHLFYIEIRILVVIESSHLEL